MFYKVERPRHYRVNAMPKYKKLLREKIWDTSVFFLISEVSNLVKSLLAWPLNHLTANIQIKGRAHCAAL